MSSDPKDKIEDVPPPQTDDKKPKSATGILRQLMTRGAARSDKRGILDAFITSDENNPTKSRIPSAFGMMVYQMLGFWSSNQKLVNVRVQGKDRLIAKTVESGVQLSKMFFDEDAISLGGKSREEFRDASLGYLTGDIEEAEKIRMSRVEEGAKKHS